MSALRTFSSDQGATSSPSAHHGGGGAAVPTSASLINPGSVTNGCCRTIADAPAAAPAVTQRTRPPTHMHTSFATPWHCTSAAAATPTLPADAQSPSSVAQAGISDGASQGAAAASRLRTVASFGGGRSSRTYDANPKMPAAVNDTERWSSAVRGDGDSGAQLTATGSGMPVRALGDGDCGDSLVGTTDCASAVRSGVGVDCTKR